MNEIELEALLSATRREALAEDERERMRALLADYASFRPVARGGGTSAWAKLTRAAAAALPRPAFAFVTALAMLAATSGATVYAAEGTLPGDFLYPVKVNMTEPAVSALAPKGEARAAWQMQLAERRITEAAILANEGRLSARTEATLAARFTEAAHAAAADIALEHDPDLQAVASTSFATRLAAYDQVLARTDHLSRASTEGDIQAAIRVAIASWEENEDGDMQATSTVSSTTNRRESVPPRSAALGAAARRAVAHAADAVGLVEDQLDATTTANARGALSDANELIREGQAQLERHNEAGAVRAFRASIGAAARLDVFTQAAATLRINAFEDAPDMGDDESFPTSTATTSDGSAAVIRGVLRAKQQVDGSSLKPR